jgi:archaellum component FlaC
MASAMPATKEDVTRAVKAGIDDVLGVLDRMMIRTDERFTSLEARMGSVEKELKAEREEIQRIFTYLDSIEKQLEISEQERLVMGHQLERLDKWVHELAGKIGYKLSV